MPSVPASPCREFRPPAAAEYSWPMTLPADTTRQAREMQLDALRRLDGPTRLEMACAMSDDARAISEAGIRHRHPEWSELKVHHAL